MKNAFLLQMDCSVRNYKRASGRLLLDVIRADQNQVYLTVGYSSLFSFMTRHYGLSEAITNDFIRVGRLDTGEEVSQKLERVMEITGKPLAETLETMMDFYLKHHCPLKKAERVAQKESGRMEKQAKPVRETPVTEQEGNPKSKTSVTEKNRKPIPAEVKHVHLRDQGQCTFHFKGKRCEGRRFLHIHHRIPVSKGGKNTAENLMTLCSRHHSLIHELSRE